MTLAASIAVALLAVVWLFQLALALGAPLGRAAWGGRHEGVLPTRLRAASAFAAIVVYPLIIIYVLGAALIFEVAWLPVAEGGMWILATLFTVGAVANLVSPSRAERMWGPVSLVIAVCSAVVATAI